MSTANEWPALERESRRARGITYDYAERYVSTSQALHRLEKLGVSGLAMMGEICLQEAATRGAQSEELLGMSEQYLERAVNSCDDSAVDPTCMPAIHSRIRLAELPIWKNILTSNRLPDAVESQRSYSAGLDVANKITLLLRLCGNSRDQRFNRELNGMATEHAVLMLSNRWTITNGLTSEWYATRSLLTEDIGCRSKVLKSWDISVWTALSSSPPEVTYKVQTKTAPCAKKKYAPDISVVKLYPDLSLEPNEYRVNLRTLQELSEAQKGDKEFIELRTDKLLDLLDRPSATQGPLIRQQATK